LIFGVRPADTTNLRPSANVPNIQTGPLTWQIDAAIDAPMYMNGVLAAMEVKSKWGRPLTTSGCMFCCYKWTSMRLRGHIILYLTIVTDSNILIRRENNKEADRSWWAAWTSNPVCAVAIPRWVCSIRTRLRQIEFDLTGIPGSGIAGLI